MFSLSPKGEVTFKKGAKPNSIKTVQRQVRDVYMSLVQEKAPLEDSLARMMFYKASGFTAQEVKQTSPTFLHAIDSASRAYCRIGTQLAKFSTMYSMDVMIPVSELSLYVDLPPALMKQASEAGLTELKVKAREA